MGWTAEEKRIDRARKKADRIGQQDREISENAWHEHRTKTITLELDQPETFFEDVKSLRFKRQSERDEYLAYALQQIMSKWALTFSKRDAADFRNMSTAYGIVRDKAHPPAQSGDTGNVANLVGNLFGSAVEGITKALLTSRPQNEPVDITPTSDPTSEQVERNPANLQGSERYREPFTAKRD